MLDRRKFLGAALGTGLAALILPGARPAPQNAVHGRLTPDCEGALRELAVQFVPGAEPLVREAYRDFLRQLPADVTVYVLCPEAPDFHALETFAGPVPCKLIPVLTGHPITAWARDRWLSLDSGEPGAPVTLLAPRGEAGAEDWPARAGDQRVHEDLALAQPGRIHAHRSQLYFDGGDFVSDTRTVFVTPAVLSRNLQHTVASRDELLSKLLQKIQQPVLLFTEAPPHHACMFMMPAGRNTVAVGDPRLAKAVLEKTGDAVKVVCGECGADFSAETQRLFDSVARQCQSAGYRVVRVPTVPGRDGRTYLTYLNVILDERPGARTVYMPTYRHVPELNTAAADGWRALGYDVKPVDCTAAYVHYGSLRCLVNVVRREK